MPLFFPDRTSVRIRTLMLPNWIAVAIVCVLHSAASAEVNFSSDVLPILADKCFVCHGPDSHPDTDLRLDLEAYATEDRGGYRAVDQTNASASEMLKRIFDNDSPMPPEEAEKQLSDSDRQIIEQWIKQGGTYTSHWAWVSPVKENHFATTTDAIDGLIERRMREDNHEFSSEASPETLARRVSLVLTGLPPQQEWLEEFLSDESPNAYLSLVEKLLESPRYGEHQARYWLDAVRYGDTHGLHLDNRRGIYPYRDWVVRAFNQNLPLDQFITWQLAGDLLENPSLEQQLATGFVRMNPSTGEGGAIAQEFQMKNNFDRVETFGTVFLGLSLTCARCHTHKYDPIEQQEYYQLLAFFNNTTEPALDGNSYTYGSTLKVPADQSAWQRWDDLQNKGNQLLEERWRESAPDWEALTDYAVRANEWKFNGWQISAPQSLDNEKGADKVGQEGNDSRSPIEGFPGTISAKQAKDRLPGRGQKIDVTVLLETKVRQTIDLAMSGGGNSKVSLFTTKNEDNANEENGTRATDDLIRTVTKSEDSGLLKTNLSIPAGLHRLTFTIVGTGSLDSMTIDLKRRWSQLANRRSWESCDLEDQLLMASDPNAPIKPTKDADGFREKAESFANQIRLERTQFTTSLVAQELTTPRETRLLRRGEYDLPEGEPLTPATPAILRGWSEKHPQNRLGLASWVTDRENPLVSRVLINRIWQRVFGAGLVRTPEDFGVQGQQPTHPQLLDWLAVEFVESGWDLKTMLRAMVTSRTFRQSSQWRKEIDDPENRLLTRAASYRLDAEVLRDLGLWVSQRLDPVMGGEGIKPYQPAGMWAALAHPASNTKQYRQDSGDRLNRRSIYVYWKRTSPHPMMTLFDAPDRESSCVRRSRTNTPLQSLGMLNETQRLEISRDFAKRLLAEPGSDDKRIERMFTAVTCRHPKENEYQACLALLQKMRNRYKQSPTDAAQLLSLGHSDSADPNLPEELAAWTVLTSTFLASDLAIMLY